MGSITKDCIPSSASKQFSESKVEPVMHKVNDSKATNAKPCDTSAVFLMKPVVMFCFN